MKGVSKRLSKKLEHGAKALEALFALYRAGLVATPEVHKVIIGREIIRKQWVNVAYRRMIQMQISGREVVLPYSAFSDKYGLCWYELTRWQGY